MPWLIPISKTTRCRGVHASSRRAIIFKQLACFQAIFIWDRTDLDYVVTEVYGPKSDKFCEWEEADGTITIQRGKRKQIIKVKSGCGC